MKALRDAEAAVRQALDGTEVAATVVLVDPEGKTTTMEYWPASAALAARGSEVGPKTRVRTAGRAGDYDSVEDRDRAMATTALMADRLHRESTRVTAQLEQEQRSLGQRYKYKGTLSDALATIKAEVERLDPSKDSLRWSMAIIDALRRLFGGRLVYFPQGKDLEVHARDALIWLEFDGRNHEQLAAKYGLAIPSIYRILQKMRNEQRRPALAAH